MSDVHQLRIEAAHKKISEVFSKDYSFTIPAYQRSYAWETTQVEELLTDLIEAMGPESNSDGFYFLGSTVLAKAHGSTNSRVVDGQQRLTTLTILFSVIRDLTEDAERTASRESYVKQVANEDEDIPETLRLKLRDCDQPFFERHIQRRGATNNLPSADGQDDVEKRIIQNATTIREKLVQIGEDGRTELLQFLLQKCYLVVVEVPTDTAARRIFTVLNARGLDLSATDILKAELLEHAGEDREVELSERWEHIEDALGRDKFSDLFTHIRMIYERDKPRTALEKGFPEHVPVFREDPLKFIDSVLEPYADALMLTLNDEKFSKQFGRKTADLVRSLDRLDNKDWFPALLLCLRLHNEGTRNDVSDFLLKLERLAYYLFTVRVYVNKRMSRYADVLDDLEPLENPRPRANARRRSSGLALTQSEASKLFDKLDSSEFYLATRIVKPILLRLEQASTDGTANYDYPTISVEHVCPQNPREDSQWVEWFSNPGDYNDWLHALGNLILLNFRKNSAAQNYDFEEKKAKYFAPGNACAFTITNEVRGYDTWKPSDLEKRHEEILRRLAKDWNLDDEFENWWNVEE